MFYFDTLDNVVETFHHLDDVHNHFVALNMNVVEAYKIVDLEYMKMVFVQLMNDPFQFHS
jgi:hypothetical protein